MRFEKEVNIYSDEATIKRFKANETSISVVQGKISALISESELVELQNSQTTMYSKLASAVMDIKSLTLNFSDLTTKYNTVSGQYNALDSKVAEYKLGLDGLSANVTEIKKDLQVNYSTTTEMNSAIKTKTDLISAEVNSVITTLRNDYSTTSQMNSAIQAKANEIGLSVSASYAKKADLAATTNRVSDLETWKSSAQLKITDSAIISTVMNSSSYKTSVNSMIEQKADSIRLKADKLSWKSKNSSLEEDGTFTCKNAIISGEINTEKIIKSWKFNADIGTINTWYYGEKITRGGFSVRSQYSGNLGEITISPGAMENPNSYTDRAYNIINSNRALLIEARVGEADKEQWSGIGMKYGDIHFKCGYGNMSMDGLSISLSADNSSVTATMSGTWKLPQHLVGTLVDTTSNSPNLWMGTSSNSKVSRCSSSSKRYKHDITDVDEELNPEKLYDLPVRSYTYNDDYLSKEDRNYGKRMIGFIAEEVEKVYPKACQYDETGRTEMWNIQIIVPAMLKLIQNQQRDLSEMKKWMASMLKKV